MSKFFEFHSISMSASSGIVLISLLVKLRPGNNSKDFVLKLDDSESGTIFELMKLVFFSKEKLPYPF
jgi:hypothetical protein